MARTVMALANGCHGVVAWRLLMTHVAPQLSPGRPTLATRCELPRSRAGKGGTYGMLRVITWRLGGALALLGVLPPAMAHPLLAGGASPPVQVIGSPAEGGIVTVRPSGSTITRQGLRQFVGISGANSGARGLSMNEVIIPPGGRAEAHRHLGSESAIFLLSGTVKTYYGPCLERSVVNRAGDFLFIPADVPHMPVNLSRTQPAIAIVARNDANEQERVELLRPGQPSGDGGQCPPVPPR